MTKLALAWRPRIIDAAAMLSRWCLGLLFLKMGLSKALHPESFIELGPTV